MSPAGSKNAPEAKAREKIDDLLAQTGWLVQDREDMNLTAGDGIALPAKIAETLYSPLISVEGGEVSGR